MPTDILHDNIPVFLPVLCKLVNASLKEGSIDGLKTADVIPTIKDPGLDRNDFKNYRPISNLSYLGKLIERVVLKRLNDHMAKHKLQIPEQSAYNKFNSTETISLKVINDLLVGFDTNSAAVLMMLDLSSAFDTVSHKKLLCILNNEIKVEELLLSGLNHFCKVVSSTLDLGQQYLILFYCCLVSLKEVSWALSYSIFIYAPCIMYATIKTTGFSVQGYADDQQIYRCFKACDQVLTLNNKIINCFKTIKEWMSE